MANDLTPKGESFDFSTDKPITPKKPKKTIPLGETVAKAERSSHADDAMSYMMEVEWDRDGYERERQFQRQRHMDQRRSGKSFRAILRALLTASKGGQVMYVCDHHQEARRIFSMTMDMAGAYLDDFFEGQHNSPSHRIIFRNGGVIHFVDYDTHRHNCHTRGVHQSHEIIDDYNP